MILTANRIPLIADGIYLMIAGQPSHILPGFRESALRASRAMVGVPLKAAAGQATVVKLQTDREVNI
jgi:hypothetical protein